VFPHMPSSALSFSDCSCFIVVRSHSSHVSIVSCCLLTAQLPRMHVGGEPAPSTTILFFCGNFGIILINSSWINVDGGKRALDMLEKMIEVTMMRGEYKNRCLDHG
jgi:hypothetical protein